MLEFQRVSYNRSTGQQANIILYNIDRSTGVCFVITFAEFKIPNQAIVNYENCIHKGSLD